MGRTRSAFHAMAMMAAAVYSLAATSVAIDMRSPNEQFNSNFGLSVSAVPDVNNDGRDDALVGAPQEMGIGGLNRAGRAYLFDGATGALLHELISPNQEAEGQMGIAVSGLGDLTGDARGDVIVGAWRESPGSAPFEAGRAYVYNGSTGAVVHEIVSPNEQEGRWFGLEVAAMTDLNGDGRAEFTVGAAYEAVGGQALDRAGYAYIFDGRTGSLRQTFTSPNVQLGGEFAESVATLRGPAGQPTYFLVGAHEEESDGSPQTAGRGYIYNLQTGFLVNPALEIRNYILGRGGDPQRLDLTLDGAVDAADLIRARLD